MDGSLNLFADALNDIANGPHGNGFHALTEGLLRRLSEKGLTLAECADRRMLNRSISTLEAHCREYGIRFPDYTPSNMRKHVTFIPSGDYLVLVGSEVSSVAKALDIVVIKRNGQEQCSLPAHGFDAAKEVLKAFGYAAKKGKAPKLSKEMKHA